MGGIILYWTLIVENSASFNWIDLINAPLISGVLGAILGSTVGGLITWGVTSMSLKTELNNQRLLEIEKIKRDEIIALKLIREEMKYNILHLKVYIKQSEALGEQFYNLVEEHKILYIVMDKWIKYADTLVNSKEFSNYSALSNIYANIQQSIYLGIVELGMAEEFIKDIDRCIIIIDEFLKDK